MRYFLVVIIIDLLLLVFTRNQDKILSIKFNIYGVHANRLEISQYNWMRKTIYIYLAEAHHILVYLVCH